MHRGRGHAEVVHVLLECKNVDRNRSKELNLSCWSFDSIKHTLSLTSFALSRSVFRSNFEFNFHANFSKPRSVLCSFCRSIVERYESEQLIEHRNCWWQQNFSKKSLCVLSRIRSESLSRTDSFSKLIYGRERINLFIENVSFALFFSE